MISHSRTVSALVKPGYSPYEQYATTASKQGPWTDIYALGATLYHAITGKRPPDSPSRMVGDEYIAAREAALSSYRASFLAAIDQALLLEVTERPQSIAAWRGTLLSPDPKRASAGLGLRLALVRTLGRRRSEALPVPAGAGKEALTVRAPDQEKTLVPLPPDAPQPKGQLLDFIDALKSRRAPRKPAPKAEAAPAAPLAARRRSAKKRAISPEAEPPSPAKRLFGFGRVPYAPATPARAPKPAAAKKEPPAARLAEDRAPAARARRVRRWRLPSRRWRSLIYKLGAGLMIAWLAVSYQSRPPPEEQRGAVIQATALAQLARLSGHTGPVTALASDDARHWIVSSGADASLKIWHSLSGALLRSIDLEEGPATALALDDRRALTGHRSGAIVLWDLQRAERLQVYHLQDGPISALAFTDDPNHFAAASPVAPLTLFDIRDPATSSALVEAGESASDLVAAARSRPLLVANGPDHMIRVWRTEPRGVGRTYRGPLAGVSALDIAAGGRLVASGGMDGSISVWSTSSSRLQRSFRAHSGRVTALAFMPSERALLATAGTDGLVKVWDLRAMRNVRVLHGHTGPVRALGFADAGRRLISAGDDGVILLWSTLSQASSN
jgi:WD40 repeat protein